MANVLSVVFGVGRGMFGHHTADTFVDRLNRKYTVLLLVVFAVAVALRRLVGVPMDCWPPAHFTAAQERHATETCWMKPYHYAVTPRYIPKADGKNTIERIPAYYHWIPTILLAQACLFLAPSIIWSLGNLKPGITAAMINGIVAQYNTATSYEERRDIVQIVAGMIGHHLDDNQRKSAGGSALNRMVWMIYGYALSALYLFVKLLYVVNVLGQLIGVSMIFSWRPLALYKRNETVASLVLPNTVLCDVAIRQLGNRHIFTLQCGVHINLLHENIYMILWWWFLFLTFVTVVNLVYWIVRMVFVPGYVGFLKSYLVSMGRIPSDGSSNIMVKSFSSSYLHGDGFLCFKILQDNAGDVVTAKVIAEVFKRYQDSYHGNDNRASNIGRQQCYPEERELLASVS